MSFSPLFLLVYLSISLSSSFPPIIYLLKFKIFSFIYLFLYFVVTFFLLLIHFFFYIAFFIRVFFSVCIFSHDPILSLMMSEQFELKRLHLFIKMFQPQFNLTILRQALRITVYKHKRYNPLS